MGKKNTTWIDTPNGGFEWDNSRECPFDETYTELEQPRAWVELPRPDYSEEPESQDPYAPKRGVFVF